MSQAQRLFFAVYMFAGSLVNAAYWWSGQGDYVSLHAFLSGILLLIAGHEAEIYIRIRQFKARGN